MTIDEAIAQEKFKARVDRIKANKRIFHNNDEDEISACHRSAEEHDQIAEWLEELKEMRKNQWQVADFWYQEGIRRAVKLIFNEIEEIKNRYDNEDFAIIGILIKIQEIALEIAEKLKAGGK